MSFIVLFKKLNNITFPQILVKLERWYISTMTMRNSLVDETTNNKFFNRSNMYSMTSYESYNTQLAAEIATALNELHALPLYLNYVKQYPEELLRKSLALVLSYDESKITKSRAALFKHMITHPNYYEDLRA